MEGYMFPHSTTDPDLLQIEKKIAPLVSFINGLGLPTYYSCEGHGGNRGIIQFSYPMVVITPDVNSDQIKSFFRLLGILGIYNSNLDTNYNVRWVLVSNGNNSIEIVLRPDDPNNYSLRELHKNLRHFVFLLKKINKWYKG